MATRKTGKGRRTFKLVWTDRALRDLKDIDDYIAADDPDAAARWVDRLMATAEKAAKLPTAGQLVKEREQEDLRQVLLKRYRIVYRILESEIHVITVFEGHRLLPDDVE